MGARDLEDAGRAARRARGLFITLEGIDSSGKTTQARLLAEALRDSERSIAAAVILVREPGGTELGERVRDLLKDTGLAIGARAEALLFAAARAELVETVILPALAAGATVISDRFVDSSLAYQGVARGLGADAIAGVNEWATGGLAPDLTFLIEIDPERAAARGAEDGDRFEDEGIALQRAVAEAYRELAAREPRRVVAIDGDRDEQAVLADLLDHLMRRDARL